MILDLPGVHEVGYGATWYGHPVNMKRVRRAGHSWIPGMVEILRLAIAQTHVQANLRPGGVDIHAGGAHVVVGAGPVLHPLHVADLSRRGMEVEHWAWCRVYLSVAADSAGGSHLGQQLVHGDSLARLVSGAALLGMTGLVQRIKYRIPLIKLIRHIFNFKHIFKVTQI